VSFFSAFSQVTTKTLAYSGSIDTYYRYNFSGQQNNYTSFTNSQSSFELGIASLKADATDVSGKVGATIDLGFGRRVEEFRTTMAILIQVKTALLHLQLLNRLSLLIMFLQK
jgi:hypothetical protein